jgi:hypothetical protein
MQYVVVWFVCIQRSLKDDIPRVNEAPTPMLLSTVATAVAVVRSLTGNHTADKTGGTPIATGPARPFRN